MPCDPRPCLRARVKAAFLAAAITDDRTVTRRLLPGALAAPDANVRAQATRAGKPFFWIVLGFIAVLQAAVSRCRSAT